MKIVINKCYGGFSLSDEALSLYNERTGANITYGGREMDRSNPDLIAVIEQLGLAKSSGSLAELEIIDIPDDIEWDIEEYDGIEWVAEKHRTWS